MLKFVQGFLFLRFELVILKRGGVSHPERQLSPAPIGIFGILRLHFCTVEGCGDAPAIFIYSLTNKTLEGLEKTLWSRTEMKKISSHVIDNENNC